ncbi:MAG: efflux RND transporter periplasmic adaptor subunit [Rikenellaceae bacterium]
MKIKKSFGIVVLMFLTSCVEVGDVTKSVQKVKCEEAKSVGDQDSSTTYPGKIVASADVNLSFRVAGVVDRIAVVEGQRVLRDQVVAYMDDRDYKLQLAATQAEYDAVSAEVERVVAMYGDKTVSQNDYDKAVSGLKQITSKLSAHRNAYADTQLRAPFDGYIQTINFKRGEAVAAGTPIIKFISASAPEVVINIPASEYLRHSQLSSAVATLNSMPNKEFTLKSVGVSHKANLNQLHEWRFVVCDDEGVYPTLGNSAMVQLIYSSANEIASESKSIIPFSAVFERDGECCVWRIDNGEAQLVKVELGDVLRNGNVIVKGGISMGDMVITAGVNSISEGQKVEPMSAPSKSNVGNIL